MNIFYNIKIKISILKKIILIIFNYYINIKINLTKGKKLRLKPFNITKNNNHLISKNINEKIISLEKKELLNLISIHIGKNLSFVKSYYINNNFHFGNQIILIKNIIFYCQIIGCKRIILSEKNNWFIKNKIINKKYKMIIELKNKRNIQYNNLIIDKTTNFLYYKKYIKPEIKFELLKEEILKNIPKIKINSKDLFIYIRSGDIFIKPHHLYSQAPLCFYQIILNNFEFKNKYIISEDKNNPVIDKLLIQYPNLIYNKNSLKIDIAYLSYAYNLIGGQLTTFLGNIIPLNDNLQNLWLFKNKYLDNIFNKINIINFSNKTKVFEMYSSDYYQKK